MMQSLVEQNLLQIDKQSKKYKLWPTAAAISVATFLLCFIPYLHIGVFGQFVWPSKQPVDRVNCDCKCFDTVFRGHYEFPNLTNFKHWYFNATLNAYKMWCLIVVGLIVAYECFKQIASCVIQQDARYTMLILFTSTIFPHYYGWWNYLNYYNEQFYTQWYHQLYFTISEIISSGLVLYLIRKSHDVQTFHILLIVSINVSHIIIGGLDQFIENILYSRGNRSQIVRDFGLVIPDMLAVVLIAYETKKLLDRRNLSLRNLFHKEELLFCFFVTSAIVLIGKNL